MDDNNAFMVVMTREELQNELTGARTIIAVLVERLGGEVEITEDEYQNTNEAFLWTGRSSETPDIKLMYREGDDGTF